MTQGPASDPPEAIEHLGAYAPLPFSEHYHGSIWHFTDSRALISMVEKRQLWATAATMLNDPEELAYGARRIIDWFNNQPNESSLHAALRTQMQYVLDDDFIEWVLENPAYVVCASTHYRVLNQWRNYGSTKGVAVKLDAHAEYIPSNPPRMTGFLLVPQWVTVEYDPDRQDKRIERVLSKIAEGNLKPLLESSQPGAASTLVRGVLASLAASMKDSAYAEEQEVRLISYLPVGYRPKHRGSDRGVIPYIEITHHENYGWALAGLDALANSLAPLPIEEVRVGPPDGDSEAQRIVGVTSLLRANGSKARVLGSTIRYLPA
ncbi:DUF2971 domain-containing protein [Microbacterium sp. YMB-B2]|uniref:DUF2971 domain-containing protein n=1 Tax=Microbacterium tenebrionis TaxID=2830665 RepID=A0A9X1LRQ4_9MICO|nr:DUF2971 domain-containing protein [Microbacterium tenebrionis]MCC2030531.1 DUF2971 domain-containing protein [Microbacterium tenebrionis]